MVRNVIYYRGIEFEQEELKAAQKYFYCTDNINDIKINDFVISRYSLWPFYQDQAEEIEYFGASLINCTDKYSYTSNLGKYIKDIEEYTPKTWTSIYDLPDNTSFIIKGETNSRKSNWKQDMFAPNKEKVKEIINRLSNDSLIGNQKIYIREYIPLFQYMVGLNELPITKEFRFFVAFGKIVSGGFYWHNYINDIGFLPSEEEVPLNLINNVINKVGDKSNFYTIDIAQTLDNKWIVIELNEGQQAGLCCINPDNFYFNLNKVLLNL